MNRFQSWYKMQPAALRALLTINVVVYLLWQIVFVHIGAVRQFVWMHLALNPSVPGILFEPWQLLTYNFLHLGTGLGGLLHVLFNMLWLVWVGREYEELHGAHKMLAVYVIGGLGGGLLTVLLHAIFPGVGVFGGPVHGASAAVLGLLTTVAIQYPFKSIALLFIGTVRLIWVVVGFLALDLLFLSGGGTSVSAHLGGALFGFLFAKAEQGGIDLAGWARIFFRDRSRRRRAPRRTSVPDDAGFLQRMEAWLAQRNRASDAGDEPSSRPAKVHPLRRSRSSAAAPVETVDDELGSEVDRILDKISEHGYDALTDEEKRILYEASKR